MKKIYRLPSHIGLYLHQNYRHGRCLGVVLEYNQPIHRIWFGITVEQTLVGMYRVAPILQE